MDPSSVQETLDLLTKVAEAKGDTFNIKITRRNGLSDLAPETWTLLNGATAMMIANKETWLVPFTGDGGGVFELFAFHASEPMKPIGSPIRFVKHEDARRPADVSLMKSPDWTGPRTLVFPKPMQGARPVETTTLTSTPVSQGPGNSQVQIDAAAYERKRSEITQNGASEARLTNVLAQMEQREAALRERERKLELESTVTPLMREIENLKSSLVSMRESARSAPQSDASPRKSMIEEITPLIALLAPMLGDTFKRSDERTQATLKAIQDASDRQINTLKEVIEKVAGKNDGVLDLQVKTSEVMGTMGNMVVQMMHQMQELQQPAEPQSVMVAVAEAISKPLDKIASAWMMKAQRESNMAGVGGQKQLPASAPASVNMNASANATDDEKRIKDAEAEIPNLMQLGQMITSKDDPKRVVDYFFDKYKEQDIQDALKETDPVGDPEVLIEALLAEWIESDPENRKYIDALKVALHAGAKARGYAAADPIAPAPLRNSLTDAPPMPTADVNAAPIATPPTPTA